MRFDDCVAVGGVPTAEDLWELKEQGFKTIVDVRSEDERFGGYVRKKAIEIGLVYVSIPISRSDLTVENLRRFYDAVYDKGNAPVYAFSRYGKRPLAFLILFDVTMKGQRVEAIAERAAGYGYNLLSGDTLLEAFLFRLANSRDLRPIIEAIAGRTTGRTRG